MKIKKAEDTSSFLTHPGHPETIYNMNFYKHARGKLMLKLMMKNDEKTKLIGNSKVA